MELEYLEKYWPGTVQAVRELGDRIGYGATMQIAEAIWESKHPGTAHSVGCCTSFLVPCKHPAARRLRVELESGEVVMRAGVSTCDWCCGSGRVTQRVRRAQEEAATGVDWGYTPERGDKC